MDYILIFRWEHTTYYNDNDDDDGDCNQNDIKKIMLIIIPVTLKGRFHLHYIQQCYAKEHQSSLKTFIFPHLFLYLQC